ncbi:MAG: sulfurtransferase TusA family protein [Gammaproteobacteria bacterium]|nr:sulfurtransferase TusA family protein [Gammaproteobacteria bacterium]MCW8909730.1 sulfurtransferase TusA family protein [Gammaproteobacteria bacterium]MCW9004937.1 sulfurtransferase TusA family protein [Gammaproteobacteria bacterium]MCW9056333.1 sulfurtransferase TusA family protein [Gammaproteobacteria bacterium]
MAVKFEELGDGQFQLDVCGYSCPHPQMYTKKALQKMSGGDVLTLVFDNPSSGESIAAMCENEGNELFEREDNNGSFIWKIRKG